MGFEMSLKQMIDEARMLADSRPGSTAGSMEDISKYRRSSDAKTPMPGDFGENRSKKSMSHPESVVSVIDLEQEAQKEEQRRWEEEEQRREEEEMLRREEEEMRRREERQRREEEEMMRLQEEEMLRLQEEEMRRRMALEEPEPVPMSRRTVSQGQERMVTPPEEAPPPPLEEMEPPPVAPVRASPGRPATTRRGQAKQANREPSVGADRYEDIIVEVRKRSLSRGPNSRMGSRTSSTVDFRTSQAELPSNSGSKVDIAGLRSSIGASSRSVAGVDLDSKVGHLLHTPPSFSWSQSVTISHRSRYFLSCFSPQSSQAPRPSPGPQRCSSLQPPHHPKPHK